MTAPRGRNESLWRPGPTAPRRRPGSPGISLPRGEAHVWRARLTRTAADLRRYEACLSPGEADRARRFVFARDRDRFVVARGLLRSTLALYLDEAPEAIRFTYGPHGKPHLDHDTALGFNVAHSGDLALYAVAATPEVGVDVEQVDPGLDVLSLARHVCAPEELSALHALPPDAQRQAFFACWTRKEALLKAWGVGLARPLDSFAVDVTPVARPTLRYDAVEPANPTRWSLVSLGPAPGVAAALALPAGTETLTCWDSPPEPG